MPTRRSDTGGPRPRSRRASLVLWAALGVLGLVLLAVPSAEGKPQRVSSKGIHYAIELTPPGEDTPVRLLIDPGKEAWLDTCWGYMDRATIRRGRGFRWNSFKDTRDSFVESALYVEVEPLGSRSFEAVVGGYRAHLSSLWSKAMLEHLSIKKTKPTKTLKIFGEKARGVRMTHELRHMPTDKPRPGTTILLPLKGHLITLSSFGAEDLASATFKRLKAAPDDWCETAHTFHASVVWGRPAATTFMVLPLPVGYDTVPNTPEDDDPDCVNRFRRVAPDGPTETLTIVRLTATPRFDTARELKAWIAPRAANGLVATETVQHELGDVDAAAFDFTRNAGGGSLIGWKSGSMMYALLWETTATEAEAIAAGRAEMMRSLTKFRSWWVRFP